MCRRPTSAQGCSKYANGFRSHCSIIPRTVAWNGFGEQVRAGLHGSGAALDGNDAFTLALRDTRYRRSSRSMPTRMG
jgi:hypothetical protein